MVTVRVTAKKLQWLQNITVTAKITETVTATVTATMTPTAQASDSLYKVTATVTSTVTQTVTPTAQASDSLYTCPLQAGHYCTTRRISHLLPDFNMLLLPLTNNYFGLRKSKDGDKAKPITIFFIQIIFHSRSGVTTC